MEEESFRAAMKELLEIVAVRRVCLVCREIPSKYCHRRFLAARFRKLGFKVTDL